MPVRTTLQGIGGNPTWGKRNPDEENFLTPPYVYRDNVTVADTGAVSVFNGLPSFQLSGERMGSHLLITSIVPQEDILGISAGTVSPDVYMLLLRDMSDSDMLSATGTAIGSLISTNTWNSGTSTIVSPVFWVPMDLLGFTFGGPIRAIVTPNLPAGEYKLVVLANGADLVHPLSIILQHTE